MLDNQFEFFKTSANNFGERKNKPLFIIYKVLLNLFGNEECGNMFQMIEIRFGKSSDFSTIFASLFKYDSGK